MTRGVRYEVEAPRLTPLNSSEPLSALRILDSANFHSIIGVIFESDFSVDYAATIPYAVVLEKLGLSNHLRAFIMHLPQDLLDDLRVDNVTAALKTAAAGTFRSPRAV